LDGRHENPLDRCANGHGLREAGAAGLILSETSARWSGQRDQRPRKKTEAMEVRIIMAYAIYHARHRIQPHAAMP
jgi:hypothetical protein